MSDNPYQTPTTTTDTNDFVASGDWSNSGYSQRLEEGLLRRRIRILHPLECFLEYRADRLSDQIFIDNELVISKLPLLWLHENFQFQVRRHDQVFHFDVKLKIGRLLKILRLEIFIDNELVYREEMGEVTDHSNAA